MIYTTKCFVCDTVGNIGVFSTRNEPKGWIVLAWKSEHSEHIEAVCSIKCLHAVELPDDDLPDSRP